MPSVILAHQGGWDELLLVAGPVAVIALLLVLADRRAKRNLERATAEGEEEAGPGGDPPPG